MLSLGMGITAAPAIAAILDRFGRQISSAHVGQAIYALLPTRGNPPNRVPQLQWVVDGVEIEGASGTSFVVPDAPGARITWTGTDSDGDAVSADQNVLIRAASSAPMPRLVSPGNLLTPAQASFETSGHVDGRGNWTVQHGRLERTGTTTNDARVTLDAPLVAGRPHYATAHIEAGGGTLKVQLTTPGFENSRGLTGDWMNFTYFPSIADTHGVIQLKPNGSFDGGLDDLRIYDLSSVDPAQVGCDVVLVGGDSNATCTTSERVTAENRDTPFDPRIWTMPSLVSDGAHAASQSERHSPIPMIEPVLGTTAAERMSPVHALAARLADRAAVRGRPLLVLSLGDPGSGFGGNKGIWSKGGHVSGANAPQMYDETLATVAAMRALGPAHEIVGMVWSLGANDTTGAGYDQAGGWLDQMTKFVSDLRVDVADTPMVLWTVGTHYEPLDPLSGQPDGRGVAMRAAQRRLDQDSGHSRALSRFRVVVPPAGNELAGPTDPHYNARGMQANGRIAGDALLSLLNA